MPYSRAPRYCKKSRRKIGSSFKERRRFTFSKDIKSLALIGPFADEKAIKGFWACCGDDNDCVTVYEGIKKLLPDVKITVVPACSAQWDDDTFDFTAAIAAAEEADAVLLCVGEPQNYSGEGNSRADIRLPGMQEELVYEVGLANDNTAMLLFTGRPLVLTDVKDSVGAILNMWFPGTEGGSAAASLLFGDANPSGKLTMSFPKSVGQCPIYYNHPSTGRPKRKDENTHEKYTSNYIGCGNLPLYPFGHGLSYSKFVYESMTLDTNTLTKGGQIKVSVTLTNDSDVAGAEVVQLYIHDLFASAVRPIAQLIDYKKTEFAPHETKTVEFFVTEPQLRFYDFECNFISEAGDFEIMVGNADNFIFKDTFELI